MISFIDLSRLDLRQENDLFDCADILASLLKWAIVELFAEPARKAEISASFQNKIAILRRGMDPETGGNRMLAKFSVKKPLTVLVAVILVLILGFVSFTSMTPDLLPNMDFPMAVLMTTYPGASPEEVEATLTKPLEQSMATLENISTVTSSSSENYSILFWSLTTMPIWIPFRWISGKKFR